MRGMLQTGVAGFNRVKLADLAAEGFTSRNPTGFRYSPRWKMT